MKKNIVVVTEEDWQRYHAGMFNAAKRKNSELHLTAIL